MSDYTTRHPRPGTAEIPGDTNAPDIASRTGEEMPSAPHDEVGRDRMSPDELIDFEEGTVQGDPYKPRRESPPPPD
jgi:hypothetical protein